MNKHVTRIHVRAISACSHRGLVMAGNLRLPCALGRSGVKARKREGDGATPRGAWRLLQGYWRPDRLCRPQTALPFRPLSPHYGWCDDPNDRNYNRPVALPYPASHERLWRCDRLYDLVIALAHNVRPRQRCGGSAVFLHLERPDGGPTAGCIALSPADLRKLLAVCGPRSHLVVH